ncbi:hypothetical protein AAKU67_001535 [Oxalobacteraceae bacterium GrIS 2.11]
MLVRKTLSGLVAAALTLTACNLAMAEENYELDMPLGIWGLDSAILPLSGFYAQIVAARYQANDVKDGNGNNVQFNTLLPLAPGVNVPVHGNVNSRITEDAVVPKFIYISDESVWGGHAGAFLAIPLLKKTRDISVNVTTPLPPPYPTVIGQTASQLESGSHRGVGDIELTSFIGWKGEQVSYLLAFNIDAPTGSYDKTSQVNLGLNHYSLRPLASVAYSTESGFDFAAALSYNFNTVNKDTKYKSGQYMALEYLGSYQFSNNIKAGLQGYYLNQTTNDEDPNNSALVPIVNGFKARIVSLGPIASYQTDDLKNQVEFKWLAETGVRNRPQGNLLVLTYSHLF